MLRRRAPQKPADGEQGNHHHVSCTVPKPHLFRARFLGNRYPADYTKPCRKHPSYPARRNHPKGGCEQHAIARRQSNDVEYESCCQQSQWKHDQYLVYRVAQQLCPAFHAAPPRCTFDAQMLAEVVTLREEGQKVLSWIFGVDQ